MQIINKIRGSDLRHRRFKLLTQELDSKFSDIMYFNNIRWLSCGQVLNRFCDLFHEIELFLGEQDMDADFSEISTFEWKQQLYFLCDITQHLNELNLKLQGPNKYIWELAKHVQEFKLKLILFKNQIIDNDFSLFQRLSEHELADDGELYDTHFFIHFLDILITEFDSRFSDFKEFDLAFKFLKNPFLFDEGNIESLANIFVINKNHLKFDISLINEETRMSNEKSEELWNRLLTECNFMALKKIIPKFLCMFGSTYVCETTFSSLTRRKNKFRNSLSQQNLESEIRCELSKSKPDLGKMAKSKECHPSH